MIGKKTGHISITGVNGYWNSNNRWLEGTVDQGDRNINLSVQTGPYTKKRVSFNVSLSELKSLVAWLENNQ